MILSLQDAHPWNSTDGIPENIGSFEIQLSFKAKNKDITSFVHFINESGNPYLLTDSGITMNTLLPTEKIPGLMSNPLITLTSFNLESALDPSKSDDDNAGRASLRIYIRWISKDDISYLKENVRNREQELWNNLAKAIVECKGKWPLCWETAKRLAVFFRKYQNLSFKYSPMIFIELTVININKPG